MTTLFNCVLIIIVLCSCCDLLESINLKRRDVHRIVLKSRSRGRPKKSTSLRLADYHNRYNYPKELNYDPYIDQYGEASNAHQETYQSPYNLKYQKNRYKTRTPYGEYPSNVKHGKEKPDKFYDNKHFDGYSSLGQQFDYDNRPVSSSNYKYAVDYNDFQRYKDMMDFYNRKEEAEYQKEFAKAARQKALFEQHQRELPWKDAGVKKQEAVFNQFEKQELPWQDSGEAFSQEESIENPAWQPSNEDYYRVWNPILSDSKPEKNPRRRKNSRHNKRPSSIEYLIDMTTSNPQKVPVTIIEENSSEEFPTDPKSVTYDFEKSLYSNHKSTNEINQDSTQPSYEVYEEESSVSPIIASFQNIAPTKTSYSTLLTQLEGDDVPSLKNKKEIRNSYGVRSKSKRVKRPAYLTL